ncbi:MAG: restriction endonuclease subunit S [Bacteroidales bacterium]|nr:restriction endonuclease subunit S [Bacteroidales bacterium]
MERYSEYKDSGVEWLGEIPRHWGLIKSKYLWKESFNLSEQGNEELLSVSQYDGITPAKGDTRSEALDGYKIVKKDDLVINIMLAWMGGLGISSYNGIVSPAYCVYKLNHNYNPRFFHYLYKTPLYLSEFAKHSTGVIPSRWRMYTDDFGQVLSLIPPIEEQNAIVAYLDKVTSKIDAAIAQQQKMIELLNERKQIIINNAVTKGLDPTAKMKPSGIPWLGNIPAHWELFRLKYLFTGYKAGPFGSSLITNALLEDGSILVYTPEHVAEQRTSIPNNLYLPENRRNELKKFFVKKGDVIFPIVGSLGRAMIIEEAMPEGIINQRLAMFSIRKEFLDTDFFMWVFGKSKFYESYIKNVQRGSFIVNLTKTLVGDMPFVLPPINEQKEISIFITNKTTEILSSISCIEKQIGLLQERKQIIINDIVTGKVKVI